MKHSQIFKNKLKSDLFTYLKGRARAREQSLVFCFTPQMTTRTGDGTAKGTWATIPCLQGARAAGWIGRQRNQEPDTLKWKAAIPSRVGPPESTF